MLLIYGHRSTNSENLVKIVTSVRFEIIGLTGIVQQKQNVQPAVPFFQQPGGLKWREIQTNIDKN